MALSPGTRFGVYEVTTQIGEGGMGQVWRARDTKLNRDVALKVLPDSFAKDLNRLARFTREAQVLASLNHPNIGQIYGIEGDALVMELVEGEDLSQRLARGAIVLDEALPLATQIADALEAAHEQGIIHRDLKPANIRVRADGTVKVLDFGLAKALEPAGTSTVSAWDSPTMTSPAMTAPGIILGTAAYMSPEQARGKAVDKRADIWAFGAVLYEMLSGQRAFKGENLSDTLASVLKDDVRWEALPADLPAPVSRLLRRCLERDPKRRLRDIGDARMEIDDALGTPLSAAHAVVPVAPVRVTWWGRIGAAVVLVGLGATFTSWRAGPVSQGAVRLSLSVPGQFFTEPPSAVMSPDGRQVAFVAADSSSKDMLWIRALDLQDARVLLGTERADEPFWSPDSRAVGFFADGQLKTVAAAGGPVQVVTSAPVSPGATWNQDGTILFAQGGRLLKISAAGGAVSPVLTPAPGEFVAWPHFLPDGRHFLYFARSAQQSPGVHVGSLDTKDTKRLLDSEFEATYAPPGDLLFVREETLMAQPFDATRLELIGEPAPVAAGAWVARGYGHGVFSAGANGALTYVSADIANTQLAWFDRGGRPLGTNGPPRRYDSPPQLSPTGSGIAVARGPFFRQDLWLLDPVHQADTRFTFDPTGSRVPVWSPDGSRIVFQSTRGDGRARLYQKNSSGAGGEELLADIPNVNLQDVSPDGRFVVYMIVGKNGHFELWVLPLFGDRQAFPFLQTEFNNGQAQVSPNGRWVAYTSNEAGRDEVYVQSFPTAGSKHQVSKDGGAQPRWRRSGGELFYLAPDHVLMAVPVKDDIPLAFGAPTVLFRTRLEFLGLQGPFFMAGYDVTADGQRFLLNAPPEKVVPPIDVLLNWTSVLSKK